MKKRVVGKKAGSEREFDSVPLDIVERWKEAARFIGGQPDGPLHQGSSGRLSSTVERFSENDDAEGSGLHGAMTDHLAEGLLTGPVEHIGDRRGKPRDIARKGRSVGFRIGEAGRDSMEVREAIIGSVFLDQGGEGSGRYGPDRAVGESAIGGDSDAAEERGEDGMGSGVHVDASGDA
jgi:hypothetical protein